MAIKTYTLKSENGWVGNPKVFVSLKGLIVFWIKNSPTNIRWLLIGTKIPQNIFGAQLDQQNQSEGQMGSKRPPCARKRPYF
jgi:hypothetical protein